jgi:hypothetical protein
VDDVVADVASLFERLVDFRVLADEAIQGDLVEWPGGRPLVGVESLSPAEAAVASASRQPETSNAF